MRSSSYDAKFIGGVFLIVGTCIGAGILALPLANAPAGFFGSTAFLILAWLVMTAGALLVMEVNLWLPRDSNMISMARQTLGFPGQITAWVTYLLLLYTLLSAYIAGGSDILSGLLAVFGLHLPVWLNAAIITAVMAWIICAGVHWADFINRGLIGAKFLAYFLLVLFILPFVKLENLLMGYTPYIFGTLMVLFTAYGFSTIVPTLRSYFEDDAVKLRLAIVLGSLIPLTFYIIWDFVILGGLAHHGDGGLIAILQSDNPNSALVGAIEAGTKTMWISHLFRFFAAVALLTSFLGVSLCLYDFLADGLGLLKQGRQATYLLALTFLPPLCIVALLPGLFIIALSVAGLLTIILLLFLPILMAWSGRYHRRISSGYALWGGKPLLVVLFICSVGLIVLGAYDSVVNFADAIDQALAK